MSLSSFRARVQRALSQQCSIAPPWTLKWTGVSQVAVYTLVGGIGSAGGLLTHDILLPYEFHHESQRGLAIATQTVGDRSREARVVKTGGDKTRC